MDNPKIALPRRARDLVQVTIAGLAVAADGTLSVDSDYVTLATSDLAGNPATSGPTNQGFLRSKGLSESPEDQEINALNTTQRHMVTISDGFHLTLDIFLVNDTRDPNPLFTLIGIYGYFLVQWVEGTAEGSIEVVSFYGKRGEFSTGTDGRGEQIASLQLGPCDPGVPQLTRSVS